MQEHVLSALVFGLSAGLKPGPLAVVVIQQTLMHGFRSGVKASLAPLITDGPIILGALLIMSQIGDYNRLLAYISLIGGLFLLYLSVKTIRGNSSLDVPTSEVERSLSTAVKVNMLSPYPYLFWITVGGSYIASGSKAASTAFVLITISVLVLSKIFLAWLASHFRSFLHSQTYLWLVRLLGILLAVFGLLLLKRAFILW